MSFCPDGRQRHTPKLRGGARVFRVSQHQPLERGPPGDHPPGDHGCAPPVGSDSAPRQEITAALRPSDQTAPPGAPQPGSGGKSASADNVEAHTGSIIAWHGSLPGYNICTPGAIDSQAPRTFVLALTGATHAYLLSQAQGNLALTGVRQLGPRRRKATWLSGSRHRASARQPGLSQARSYSGPAQALGNGVSTGTGFHRRNQLVGGIPVFTAAYHQAKPPYNADVTSISAQVFPPQVTHCSHPAPQWPLHRHPSLAFLCCRVPQSLAPLRHSQCPRSPPVKATWHLPVPLTPT